MLGDEVRPARHVELAVGTMTGAAPAWYEKPIEVRWRDMDAFGHVNNAVYLTYFEEVRDELLARIVGEVRSQDYVLGRIAVTFLKPVKQSDGAVLGRCRLAQVGNSTIHTREEVVDQEGTVCARSESVVVAIDHRTERSRELSDDERTLLAGGMKREEPRS